MKIRAALPDDYQAIRTTLQAAFEQDTEADLVEALRRSNDAIIELVARADELIVGHVLISRLESPEQCVALAPVSVLPTHQGRGIGSALIKEAIAQAIDRGESAMFLLGEPAYYSRFVFSVEACAEFDTHYPKAYMMVSEFAEDGLRGLTRRIAYARPFDELSS